MSRSHRTRAGAFLLMLATASPALAADEEAQLWATQSIDIGLDDDTRIQINAIERARGDAFGGNQVQVSGGVEQDIGGGFSVAGSLIYQHSGGQDEIRLQQQISYTTGPLSLRTRLEQRFQEGVGRTVWRLRQRVQLTETLDADGEWAVVGSVEGFVNLNRGNPDSRTGLAAVRTQAGMRHALSKRLSLTLSYVRQHEFRDGRPDRVGHAPVLALSFSL